jgi:Heterokaryon incompatibility protein (HET)
VPLWIDAVCINQADLAEKSQQVAIMGEIYGDAKDVIVWLGASADDSDLAMDLIELWWCVCEVYGDPIKDHLDIILKGLRSLNKKIETPFHRKAWIALDKLFERPWWIRQWVVQEVALAKQVQLMVGNKQLAWTALCKACEAWHSLSRMDTRELLTFEERLILGRSRCPASMMFVLLPVIRTMLLKQSSFPESLLRTPELIHCFKDFKTTDPRDRIFSLLSLIDGHNLTPDYEVPVSQVYTDLATSVLQSEPRFLRSLSNCSWGSGHGDLDLPSWVPDWSSTNTMPSQLVDTLYDASYKTLAEFSVSRELRLLRAKGICFDIISDVLDADRMFATDFEGNKFADAAELHSYLSKRELNLSWKDWVPTDGDAKYPAGERWGLAFTRTMVFDTDITKGSPKRLTGAC